MKNPKSLFLRIFRRFSQPEFLSLGWRIGILTVCLLLYLALFFLLYPILDGSVSAFTAIPILTAAWYFGFRVANISFFSISILHFLLYATIYGFNFERFIRSNGLTGALFLFACSAFIGRMSDLRKKAQDDLQIRISTEKALSSNRAHLQALYQNIQDAVFFVNDHIRIIEVNPSACRLLGLSHDRINRHGSFHLLQDYFRIIKNISSGKISFQKAIIKVSFHFIARVDQPLLLRSWRWQPFYPLKM